MSLTNRNQNILSMLVFAMISAGTHEASAGGRFQGLLGSRKVQPAEQQRVQGAKDKSNALNREMLEDSIGFSRTETPSERKAEQELIINQRLQGMKELNEVQVAKLKTIAIAKAHDIYLSKNPQTRGQVKYKPVNRLTPEQASALRQDPKFERNGYKVSQVESKTEPGKMVEVIEQNIYQSGQIIHENLNFDMNKVAGRYVDAVLAGKKNGLSVDAIASEIHNAWVKNDAWQIEKLFETVSGGRSIYKAELSEIYQTVEGILLKVSEGKMEVSEADMKKLLMFREFDRLTVEEQIKDYDQTNVILDLANQI